MDDHRMQETATLPPATAVIGLVNAHFGARAVHVAAEVGLADALGVDEVLDAQAPSQGEPAAIQVQFDGSCEFCTPTGCSPVKGDYWRHNAASAVLRSDHP